jgi:hypothetical protein
VAEVAQAHGDVVANPRIAPLWPTPKCNWLTRRRQRGRGIHSTTMPPGGWEVVVIANTLVMTLGGQLGP